MDPKGTIVYTAVGRPHYGFDIFSVKIPSEPTTHFDSSSERRLTDGISINYNAQFLDENQTIVYVSERTGSSRLYLTRPGSLAPVPLPSFTHSLFHDRPVVNNGRLYFISAHKPNDQSFKSWSALYSSGLHHDENNEIVRLTPHGSADYSPDISCSGKLIAVASYGSRPWPGDFRDLWTDIVVFRASDPSKRTVVCEHGGWPTWSGDSAVFFHRLADDGWWSIFSVHFETHETKTTSVRVTPPGVHCFTPAAFPDGRRIAVATRRRGSKHRHVEIFDLLAREFRPVTELLNPNFHHYNPFVSPNSSFLGYHRFRGESAATASHAADSIVSHMDAVGSLVKGIRILHSESTRRSPVAADSMVPHLDAVASPVNNIQMLMLNGQFPSFSPDGDLIAFNHDFGSNSGLKIVRSDGTKRWTLLKDRTAFYNSWSPAEKNVIFTSVGPIFASVKATVQIARIWFDRASLDDRITEEEDIRVPVEIKLLTREGTGNNAFPSCSPDGKLVVFRSGRSGHKNLYIVDAVNGEEADGAGLCRLTEGPWIDTMPSWSPDGKLIAFSSNMHNPDDPGGFSIYLVHPDGTGLRRVYLAGPEGSSLADRERINHVCFSPDGEWLLFTANLGGITVEPVSVPNQFQPYGELYVARLDGSGLRRLTWNGYENGTPAWYQGVDLDVGRQFGDKLKGEFDEPVWIKCDF